MGGRGGGSVAAGSILNAEPAQGTLSTGTNVFVDDGSCPQGQIKQVTGSKPGVPRAKRCVKRP